MALHPKASSGVLFFEGELSLPLHTTASLHLPPSPQKPWAPAYAPSPFSSAAATLAAVVALEFGAPGGGGVDRGTARAQGGHYFHDIGHDHLAGAHGLESPWRGCHQGHL